MKKDDLIKGNKIQSSIKKLMSNFEALENAIKSKALTIEISHLSSVNPLLSMNVNIETPSEKFDRLTLEYITKVKEAVLADVNLLESEFDKLGSANEIDA